MPNLDVSFVEPLDIYGPGGFILIFATTISFAVCSNTWVRFFSVRHSHTADIKQWVRPIVATLIFILLVGSVWYMINLKYDRLRGVSKSIEGRWRIDAQENCALAHEIKVDIKENSILIRYPDGYSSLNVIDDIREIDSTLQMHSSSNNEIIKLIWEKDSLVQYSPDGRILRLKRCSLSS